MMCTFVGNCETTFSPEGWHVVLVSKRTLFFLWELVLCMSFLERAGHPGLEAGRSEGFPRTRITKRSCACDCRRGLVSVGALFFSFFCFFFLLLPLRIVP